MKKFIALFDLHFGYEKGLVNGKYIDKATHNLRILKAVTKFINHFRPEILICGGDQLNCGPVSHWNRNKPRLLENLRLKDELDLFKKYIMTPFKGIQRKIFMKGNHEAWLDQYIQENPSLEGLLECEKYLKLKEEGWEIYEQGAIVKIGKLYFAHGDTLLGSGRYVNPAQQLLNQTRVNIRCGHLHTYFAATDFNPIKSTDYHTSIVVPCVCNTNCFYMKNKPSKVLNGFLYGYILPDGNFTDHVVIAHNNKFVIDGVKYEG